LERSRRTEGQRKFFTCYLSSFSSLSARGPTRRRNSTGLAELWGGWPIELVPCHHIVTTFQLIPVGLTA
jgi:hypothetical protein